MQTNVIICMKWACDFAKHGQVLKHKQMERENNGGQEMTLIWEENINLPKLNFFMTSQTNTKISSAEKGANVKSLAAAIIKRL